MTEREGNTNAQRVEEREVSSGRSSGYATPEEDRGTSWVSVVLGWLAALGAGLILSGIVRGIIGAILGAPGRAAERPAGRPAAGLGHHPERIGRTRLALPVLGRGHRRALGGEDRHPQAIEQQSEVSSKSNQPKGRVGR